MEDNLCCGERRRKIIEFLVANRSSTREELAHRFNVSKRTITRDIVMISSTVPIFTKSGNQGGIYIMPGYKINKEYLTLEEEQCLRELLTEATHDRKKILSGILARFSMGT